MSKDEVIDMVFDTARESGPEELACFHWFLMMEIES